MNYSITTSSYFNAVAKRLAKKYPLLRRTRKSFVKNCLKTPSKARNYRLVFAIRMAIKSKGKGKSGGARVITYNFLTAEMNGKIVLLLIYDKEDASTQR